MIGSARLRIVSTGAKRGQASPESGVQGYMVPRRRSRLKVAVGFSLRKGRMLLFLFVGLLLGFSGGEK